MEIRLLNKDKKSGKISFLLKDSTTSFVNAIRRIILHDVPSMAIEEVEIKKNSSVLYDEMVALRLGLTPLKTDLKSYDLSEDCNCGGAGCAKCQLTLTLKAKGPGIITASQIESKDPKVVPVHPDMPIAKLLKGQQLEIEATAILGKGKEHVKWSPGLVFYKYKPVVDINKNPENGEEIAKRCSPNVFNYKNGKLSINKDNYFACHLCGECANLSKDIQLNEKNTDFIFYIEPFGQLTVNEMVTKAVDIFDSKLDEFIEKLK